MRRREGFSLVELLVAIAIIGVLSAILFPVFLSARERAKRTYCVNNMRQIFVALQMYADDNSGYMPPSPRDISSARDRSLQADGFALLRSYCRNGKNIFRCPNAGSREGAALNAAGKQAASLNEPPYDIRLPDNTVWQCSYHFWPGLYGYRIQVQDRGEWTQGRLDCNITDRNMRLANQGMSPAVYRKAIEIGGPLVDNFLHYYGGKDKDQHGILCLTVKGSIKFLPTDKYPW